MSVSSAVVCVCVEPWNDGIGKRMSEVCVTLYSMCFQKTTGGETILKHYKLNDGEWLLSHRWTVQTHNLNTACVLSRTEKNSGRINVDAT